jgi:4-amino-4-deoxy-L-arabinose transferase-like glycosyltransferase
MQKKQLEKSVYPFLIVALILAFFIYKLLFFFRFHNVIWDESVYLSMGKYLYSLGNMGFWEIERPIGLPFVLGLLWKLGFDYAKSAEFIEILFACGNIFLTYIIGKIIGKKFFNRKIALLSSFLVAITSIFFLYSNYILSEIPSTFFCLLAVYFFLNENYRISAVFAAIGSYFRLPQGLLLIAFLLILLINNSIQKKKPNFIIKQLFQFALFFGIAMVPYFLFNLSMYSAETSRLTDALFRPWILGSWGQINPAEMYRASTPLSTALGNIFYYIYFPVFGFNEFYGNIFLGLAFIGLFIFFYKKLWKNKQLTTLIILFLVYLFYLTLIPNKQIRFLNMFLPYYSLIASFAVFFILDALSKKFKWKYADYAFLVLLIIGSYLIMEDNMKFYGWRYAQEPAIVTQYYKYFNSHPVDGPIITTDPVPAVYSDFKFVPIYYFVESAESLYDKNKGSAKAIVFSSESYFCAPTDTECKNTLARLANKIKQENTLVFTATYPGYLGNRTYYIYLRK